MVTLGVSCTYIYIYIYVCVCVCFGPGEENISSQAFQLLIAEQLHPRWGVGILSVKPWENVILPFGQCRPKFPTGILRFSPSIYLSTQLAILYIFFYQFTCLSIHLSTYLINQSIYLSINVSIYLPTYLSLSLSLSPCSSLFIHAFICLYLYLSLSIFIP